MAAVSADSLLAVWESAVSAGADARALALLEPMERMEAAALPLGSRDALLLGLYSELRGPHVEALATCPECVTTLEISLLISDLVEGYPLAPAAHGLHDVDLGGVVVRARCPTTADLDAILSETTIAAARAALVDRCVESVLRADGDGRALDDAELERLGSHLEVVDPLVDVRLDVCCSACNYSWSALLDVPELTWAQVAGAARRLLREVDALAERYGWSEAEIIGLSERRRRAYLDMT
jgi:hypothetical protein